MAPNEQSVLITGGNGFIASHIVAKLIEVRLSISSQHPREEIKLIYYLHSQVILSQLRSGRKTKLSNS